MLTSCLAQFQLLARPLAYNSKLLLKFATCIQARQYFCYLFPYPPNEDSNLCWFGFIPNSIKAWIEFFKHLQKKNSSILLCNQFMDGNWANSSQSLTSGSNCVSTVVELMEIRAAQIQWVGLEVAKSLILQEVLFFEIFPPQESAFFGLWRAGFAVFLPCASQTADWDLSD